MIAKEQYQQASVQGYYNVGPDEIDCVTTKDISEISLLIIEKIKHIQKKEPKSESVFVGRFITDEEYQQMSKSKRSDISVLLEEVNKEYEYLKELNK